MKEFINLNIIHQLNLNPNKEILKFFIWDGADNQENLNGTKFKFDNIVKEPSSNKIQGSLTRLFKLKSEHVNFPSYFIQEGDLIVIYNPGEVIPYSQMIVNEIIKENNLK